MSNEQESWLLAVYRGLLTIQDSMESRSGVCFVAHMRRRNLLLLSNPEDSGKENWGDS